MEKSNKWRARKNHAKIVDVLNYEAELRIAEIKHRVVVYSTGGRIYVRRYEEFISKFEQIPS